MANKIRVGKGKSSVTIEGALAQDLFKELQDNLGPVIDEIQNSADQVLKEANETWPVKTGRSLAGFFTVPTITDLEIEISILNEYKYVRYIKSDKLGKKDSGTRNRSPLQTDIRKPARAQRKILKKTLPKILGEALQEAIKES